MTEPTTPPAAGDGSVQEMMAQAFNRRSFLRAGLGTAAVVTPAMILAACGSTSSSSSSTAAGAATSAGAGTTAATVETGGSLIVATQYAALGLDPATASGATSINVWLNMYDTLFDTGTPASLAVAKADAIKGVPPAPMMARTWEATSDQKTWHLTLQPNAKSAAGNPLTADDVVYSFQRGIALEYTPAFFFSIAGITKASQVKKVSDLAVEISLPTTPPLFFLEALAVPWNVIYDSVTLKQNATKKDPWATAYLKNKSAGFGPYEVESITSGGTNTVLSKQSGYWGDANLDKITFTTETSSSSQVQLLLSSGAQLADDIPYSDLKQVATGSSTKVTEVATPGFMMIGMDNSLAPYDDVTVRQAIATAIPQDEIIKSVYEGYGTAWQTLLPPYSQAATDEYWTYTGGPAAAKKLLAGKSVAITLSYSSGSSTQQSVAILVQSSLKAAGIDCTLDALEQATYDTKRLAGQLACWLDDVNTPAINSSFYCFRQLYAQPQIQTVLHYKYAPLNALVDKLAAASGVTAQNTLIRAGQKMLMEQLPAIPVAWTGFPIPSASDVTGFKSHSLNILWPRELSLTAA